MLDSNPFVNYRNGIDATQSTVQGISLDTAYISPDPLLSPPTPSQILHGRRGHPAASAQNKQARQPAPSAFPAPTPVQGLLGPPTPSPRPPPVAILHHTSGSLHRVDSGDHSDEEERKQDLQAMGAYLLRGKQHKQDDDAAAAGVAAGISHVQLVKSSDIKKLDVVGRGSFGEVWEVSWMGTRVAAKYLLQSKPDPKMLKEVEMLQHLTHPAIIRLLGVCMDPAIILTQFYPRGSLYTCIRMARFGDPIKKRKLSWLCSLQMLEDVASGMMFLHAHNTLHGDLRTPNILLERDYRARIGDFGLAKVMQTGGGEPVSKTTNPRWLAPEVYLTNKLTKEGDVYSFGIIMLELLTWTEPYEDMNEAQVVMGLSSNPPCRPEVPMLSIPRGRHYIFLDKYMQLMRSCWDAPQHRPTFAQLRNKLACMRRWAMLAQDIPRVSWVRQGSIISYWQRLVRKAQQQREAAAGLYPDTLLLKPSPPPSLSTSHVLSSGSTLSDQSTHPHGVSYELVLPPKSLKFGPPHWYTSTGMEFTAATPTSELVNTRVTCTLLDGAVHATPPGTPSGLASREIPSGHAYPDVNAALDQPTMGLTSSEERHSAFMQLGAELGSLLGLEVRPGTSTMAVREGHTGHGASSSGGSGMAGIQWGEGTMEQGTTGCGQRQGSQQQQQQAWTHCNVAGQDGAAQRDGLWVTHSVQGTAADTFSAQGEVAAAGPQLVLPVAGVAPLPAEHEQPAEAQEHSVPMADTGHTASRSTATSTNTTEQHWGSEHFSSDVLELAERVMHDMQLAPGQQQGLLEQLVEFGAGEGGEKTRQVALMVLCQLVELDGADGAVKRCMLHSGVVSACCSTLHYLIHFPPPAVSAISPLSCCLALLHRLWSLASSPQQAEALQTLLALVNPAPVHSAHGGHSTHGSQPQLQPIEGNDNSVVAAAGVRLLLLLQLQLQCSVLAPMVRQLLLGQGLGAVLQLLCGLPSNGEEVLEAQAIQLLAQWSGEPALAAELGSLVTDRLESGPAGALAEKRLGQLLKAVCEARNGAVTQQAAGLLPPLPVNPPSATPSNPGPVSFACSQERASTIVNSNAANWPWSGVTSLPQPTPFAASGLALPPTMPCLTGPTSAPTSASPSSLPYTPLQEDIPPHTSISADTGNSRPSGSACRSHSDPSIAPAVRDTARTTSNNGGSQELGWSPSLPAPGPCTSDRQDMQEVKSGVMELPPLPKVNALVPHISRHNPHHPASLSSSTAAFTMHSDASRPALYHMASSTPWSCATMGEPPADWTHPLINLSLSQDALSTHPYWAMPQARTARQQRPLIYQQMGWAAHLESHPNHLQVPMTPVPHHPAAAPWQHPLEALNPQQQYQQQYWSNEGRHAPVAQAALLQLQAAATTHASAGSNASLPSPIGIGMNALDASGISLSTDDSLPQEQQHPSLQLAAPAASALSTPAPAVVSSMAAVAAAPVSSALLESGSDVCALRDQNKKAQKEEGSADDIICLQGLSASGAGYIPALGSLGSEASANGSDDSGRDVPHGVRQAEHQMLALKLGKAAMLVNQDRSEETEAPYSIMQPHKQGKSNKTVMKCRVPWFKF